MDTRDTRVQNLLFLLMAAPMAMGACIITDGDDDTDGDDSNNQTSSNETDAETDAPATDGETDDPPPATGSGDDTGTGGETEGETESADGTTTGGESEGETDTPPGACADYADLITECYNEKEGMAVLDYCGEYLQQLYDSYGEGCVTAYEDYLACLSGLTCDELMGADPVCEAEETALDEACVAG